jgi:hypothetical protein
MRKRRAGKGANAPCPPMFDKMRNDGGHATLCPPYVVAKFLTSS